MRIGMLSPLEMRVPPVGYGGTELVASLLTEELVARGHEVTLFASGDSVTSAQLQSVFPHFLRGSPRDKHICNMLNAVACFRQADSFDIIHNHTLFEGLALSMVVNTPVLTTLHGPLEGDYTELFDAYKGYYNTISHAAKRRLPDKGYVGVIYNAIDCHTYPFGEDGGDYLLFLSRIARDKGPHLAIEVARRLGKRLIIAGNVDTPDREYFHTQVEPQVDGDLIIYVGEADYYEKRRLFASAHCLLLPLLWEEPFGLVMAEAMASGTPVIAFNRGAAPELISHGATGFIVQDVEEMAAAVNQVHHIDRHFCREHVERHFSVSRMADDYLATYQRILLTEALQLPTLPPASATAYGTRQGVLAF
ncbi:MAG: glycosyltransferase family 4 protein [Chloroflexi bacterium]|nr:glycosyltransferase family 4 protein [Chloroflexota bacterium]